MTRSRGGGEAIAQRQDMPLRGGRFKGDTELLEEKRRLEDVYVFAQAQMYQERHWAVVWSCVTKHSRDSYPTPPATDAEQAQHQHQPKPTWRHLLLPFTQ